jgi:hypothetical protein
MVSFDDGFDQYYEEKAVEFFLVTTSIIYFALLIPTIVDVFEDKSVKERICELEIKVATLERLLCEKINE